MSEDSSKGATESLLTDGFFQEIIGSRGTVISWQPFEVRKTLLCTLIWHSFSVYREWRLYCYLMDLTKIGPPYLRSREFTQCPTSPLPPLKKLLLPGLSQDIHLFPWLVPGNTKSPDSLPPPLSWLLIKKVHYLDHEGHSRYTFAHQTP